MEIFIPVKLLLKVNFLIGVFLLLFYVYSGSIGRPIFISKAKNNVLSTLVTMDLNDFFYSLRIFQKTSSFKKI